MGKHFRLGAYTETDLAAFNTSAAYGSVPVFNFGVYPTPVRVSVPGPIGEKFARVRNIHFKLVPTNAVTFQLYLYSDNLGAANSQQLEMNKFYDSVRDVPIAQCVANTEYHMDCDRTVYLSSDFGNVYFVLVWSGAPGATAGYIEVSGERDG